LQELEEDPEMRAQVALYKDPTFNPAAAAAAQRQQVAMAESEDEEDGDVPQVPLEELLDDLAALGLEDEAEGGLQFGGANGGGRNPGAGGAAGGGGAADDMME
jgi:nonsense-mediated mRNA decay protein 3